jgi:beta-glucanase (GH16 family)
VHSTQSLADDFHVYGLNWSPDLIEMTLDGVVYATFTRNSLSEGQTWVFDKPFYLILNLAVGGNWPGCPDASTPFPATMLVDWVRVYSADSVGPSCSAKNATVRRDRRVSINFRVYDKLSSQVSKRVVISKDGVVKKRWSWSFANSTSRWSVVRFACDLRRGTYRVTVTGRDLAGNPASVVGRARLVVR